MENNVIHHHHYHLPYFGKVPYWIFILNILHMVIWTIMLPISLLTNLKSSVPYLVAISVWALVTGAISGTITAYGIYKATKEQE